MNKLVRTGGVAFGATLVLMTIFGSFYVVDPTEMAGVRRLGTVVSREPVPPGLHSKAPWVDRVDRLQTSLSRFEIKDLTVYTVDNQSVTIGVNMTYQIPASGVLHLLYQVGQAGDFDIWGNVEPVVADRTMRVFARQNTIEISVKREAIAGEIRTAVAQSLKALFGIDVLDLQITSIRYSPTFVASVEAAVKAKNDAIQAENTVNRVRFEADQAKARAEGEAAARVTAAAADRQVAVLRAQGEAEAITITAEARAKQVQAIGAALASSPGYVGFLSADRWNGVLPQTTLGGAATPQVLFGLAGK